MALFGSSSGIPTISTFPSAGQGGVVLNIDDSDLVTLYPAFIMDKHRGEELEGSKFDGASMSTYADLCRVLSDELTSSDLSDGGKVEKTITYPDIVGSCRVVEITPKQRKLLPRQTIERGDNSFREISTMYVREYPRTRKVQVKLVPYNPDYDAGNLNQAFEEKHEVTFDEFGEAWAVLTVFPGSDAPPMHTEEFKNTYAFLEKR